MLNKIKDLNLNLKIKNRFKKLKIISINLLFLRFSIKFIDANKRPVIEKGIISKILPNEYFMFSL